MRSSNPLRSALFGSLLLAGFLNNIGCTRLVEEREPVYTDEVLLKVTDAELERAESIRRSTGFSYEEAAKARAEQRKRHAFAKQVRAARARHAGKRAGERLARTQPVVAPAPAHPPGWGAEGMSVEDYTIMREQGVFVVTRRLTMGSRRYDPVKTSLTVREGALSRLGTGRTTSIAPAARLHLMPDAAHAGEHVLALPAASGDGYVELLRLRKTRGPIAEMVCRKIARGMGTTCALS